MKLNTSDTAILGRYSEEAVEWAVQYSFFLFMLSKGSFTEENYQLISKYLLSIRPFDSLSSFEGFFNLNRFNMARSVKKKIIESPQIKSMGLDVEATMEEYIKWLVNTDALTYVTRN